MPLVTVIGRGHSGTRAISHTLSASGVDMGAPLNESGDLLPAEPMYEACRVAARYVDWHGGLEWDWQRMLDDDIPAAFRQPLDRFLTSVHGSCTDYRGWKIPETTLCFPWIARLYPEARFIFWIRNPRDCIIGGHVTDQLDRFAVPAPAPDHQRHARAISWIYQYYLVKATPRPQNWIEVRFEDFVLNQEETLTRLENFLGIPLARIPVRPESVGRWRRDDQDPASGPNYFEFFEPAMREYGYEIPAAAVPAGGV